MLGRPRTQKYEAQAGISLADMFRLASDPDQITVPAIARKRLLDLVLFNLVIGNRDSHAKNYALLRHGSKAELAPAYDLVCTEIYENLDRSLPQKIGDAGQLEAITPGDLAVFAEQIELRPRVVRRELVKAAKTVANALPTVVEQLTSRAVADEARDVIAKVQKRIRSNTKATRKIAR